MRQGVRVCTTELLTCQRSCRLCLSNRHHGMINTVNSCICRYGQDGCIDHRVHGFGAFTMFTPDAKMIQVSARWCRQSHMHEGYAEGQMRHCTRFSIRSCGFSVCVTLLFFQPVLGSDLRRARWLQRRIMSSTSTYSHSRTSKAGDTTARLILP